ncbi:hypothetical protein [Azospirillum halopraeferens]|uniref:hypothetical protein n=1 Tax=Azospirillum halopraeferens TaxID=34010 RepID=UPI001FE00100|nr:hypothetical protein [Azospirillum halopraeferens]
MSVRTVTFDRPFALRAVDDVQPAGRYVVETEEELVELLSFTAYRRIGTWIRLPQRPGSTDGEQLVPVDPEELEGATELAEAPGEGR